MSIAASVSAVKERILSSESDAADSSGKRPSVTKQDSGSGNIPLTDSSLINRLMRELLRPVDNSSQALFRITFGLAVAWYGIKNLMSGAVDYHYVRPALHFSYYGFDWIQPWPGGMYFHFVVMIAAALCYAIGLFYRASALVLFLSFTYVFLCERSLYNNHYYLMSLLAFLSLFIPLQRCWSLDALRLPRTASRTLPAWTLWLLRFQLGIVYFYGGLAKLNSDWLSGQPMRMWLEKMTHYPLIGTYFTEEWAVQIFVWGGLLLDLLTVPLLLWRRTRMFTFGVIILFHMMNATLFQIGVFPWLMIGATTLYFPPDWPRRLVRTTNPAPHVEHDLPVVWNRRLQLGTTLLCGYVLLQLLIPFRHHLSDGPASWTEQGHFFSWRMMLRDKYGYVRLQVRDPATGREGLGDYRPYLTRVQEQKMIRSPEHILQLCHFLAGEYRRLGLGETEIRAQAMISLNGRKPQLLIDPTVDLVREQQTLGGYDWILPLTEPLRQDAWDIPLHEWEL